MMKHIVTKFGSLKIDNGGDTHSEYNDFNIVLMMIIQLLHYIIYFFIKLIFID